VDTDKISRETAEDQGRDLWNDRANAGADLVDCQMIGASGRIFPSGGPH
jgi:hypothetical protein